MKKVTFMVLVTLSMFSFNCSTGFETITNTTKAEAINFSIDKNSFSTADALESYIAISPSRIKIFYYTRKYCKEDSVPEAIAFGILKLETNYDGPTDLSYNQNQTSYANAYGPYQLLLGTARDMYVLLELGNREDLTPEMLLHNTKLNVRLGIRYLKYLHDNISKNWKITCGYYNTGYKKINEYALNATKYMRKHD